MPELWLDHSQRPGRGQPTETSIGENRSVGQFQVADPAPRWVSSKLPLTLVPSGEQLADTRNQYWHVLSAMKPYRLDREISTSPGPETLTAVKQTVVNDTDLPSSLAWCSTPRAQIRWIPSRVPPIG